MSSTGRLHEKLRRDLAAIVCIVALALIYFGQMSVRVGYSWWRWAERGTTKALEAPES